MPQIHQQLQTKGLSISERSVSNLLARYDELVSLKVSAMERIRDSIGQQQYVIVAIDGMQPDVGHEVLWVIRECFSGEILKRKNVAVRNQRRPGSIAQTSFACLTGTNYGSDQ